MACTAEGFKAGFTNALGCAARGDQGFAWVEFAGLLGKQLTHGAGHGQADVCIYVDLAHAALDATHNFFYWHAIGLLDIAAVLTNDFQPLLRHAGAAVHYQMGVGYGFMGGILAWILVTVSVHWMSAPVARLADLYQSFFQLEGLGSSGLIGLLLIGAGLGFLGAWLAVARQLSSIEPK